MPVIIGETAARYSVLAMLAAQYLLCVALVLAGSFGWPLLLVLASLPALRQLFTVYGNPKPASQPEHYPQGVWPLWFSAFAFDHTRKFTSIFVLALLVEHFLA